MNNFFSNKKMRRLLLTGSSISVLTAMSMQVATAKTFELSVEGAIMTPLDSSQNYGATYTFPTGTSYSDIDNPEGHEFRVGGKWFFANPWNVGLSYGNFDSQTTNASSSGTYNYPTIVTAPNVSALGAVFSQYFVNSSAKTDTDVEFLDFSVGYDVGIGQGSVELFGGARYVKVEQSTTANFNHPSAFYYFHNLDVTRKSEYKGFGPRIGVDTMIPLSGGLSFDTLLSVSALFGDLETTISGSDFVDPAGPGTITTPIYNRTTSSDVSYSLEIAPALSYRFGGESMSGKLSVGYRFEKFLGVVDTATRQTVLTGLATSGDSTDALQYSGPFLRLNVGF